MYMSPAPRPSPPSTAHAFFIPLASFAPANPWQATSIPRECTPRARPSPCARRARGGLALPPFLPPLDQVRALRGGSRRPFVRGGSGVRRRDVAGKGEHAAGRPLHGANEHRLVLGRL